MKVQMETSSMALLNIQREMGLMIKTQDPAAFTSEKDLDTDCTVDCLNTATRLNG